MKFVILATGTQGDVQPSWPWPRLRSRPRAVLAAGKPTLVTRDHGPALWGRVVHRAWGLPIPRRRLTAERLAAAIGTLTTDEDIQRRAAALGEAIRRGRGRGR